MNKQQQIEEFQNDITDNLFGGGTYKLAEDLYNVGYRKETPFKVYIYETYDKKYDDIGICWGEGKTFEHGCKKVIGEFICDEVYSIKNQGNSFVVANEEQGVTNEIARQSCLDYDDMVGYLGNKDGYGWHISDLKIYDKPKELSEFSIPCKTTCENCKKPLYYDCWREEKGIKIVTRPPQSYMIVEEREER